ncbi:MAG: SAM-dependent methyltransferase [Methylobacterium sp.]|uniref:methyltransferase domain-containing protein n=1 Tax=Methylobacterium sp. TaxID=409 RepID=UPI002583CE4D|nr:methyltransferase domain-containing protein [Methylobacterium sp.]MBY0294491.1 SAM-dependent methyltransferase [Methylobacterium sp.]
MTGFSAAWLALREPADHAARDPGLTAALAGALADRDGLRVVDLGCGAGSNLRALAPHLPPEQHWCLVDHDPALLGAARAALADWADAAEAAGEALRLRRGDRRITVAFRRHDLAVGLGGLLDEERPDLVTAAALFDLVSEDWIERAARAVAASGAVFHTVLTYDGEEEWTPPHPADAALHAAFLAHQTRDKGFGPAAGPAASDALGRAFRALGYRTRHAESPWRFGAGPLLAALAEGKAAAAAETGMVAPKVAQAWAEARRAPETRAVIGHIDLLALPGA